MLRAEKLPAKIVENSTTRFALNINHHSLLEEEVLNHLPLDEELEDAAQADHGILPEKHLTVK